MEVGVGVQYTFVLVIKYMVLDLRDQEQVRSGKEVLRCKEEGCHS